jgi:hypothetical protein
MAQQAYSALYKRHRTNEPLVTYRERRDGTRSYSVQHRGTHVPAGSTLEEAHAFNREQREQRVREAMARAAGSGAGLDIAR